MYQVSKGDLQPSEGKRMAEAEEGGRVPELQLQQLGASSLLWGLETERSLRAQCASC